MRPFPPPTNSRPWDSFSPSLLRSQIYLSPWVHFSCHEREQGFGVIIGLLLAGCAGILAVVGQLLGAAQGAHRVRVDNAGAAAGHHGPDPALGVQNGELENKEFAKFRMTKLSRNISETSKILINDLV